MKRISRGKRDPGPEMLRYGILGLVLLVATGCIGYAVRANQGSDIGYYSKAGATWESRDADWKACGGCGPWWCPTWETEKRGAARACMLDKGYEQSTTASEPDGGFTKPAR